MATLTYTDELVTETCWCGMHHAVPRQLRDHMKDQHRNGQKQTGIFCPLGHSWVFGGKSEVDEERKRREAAEARAQAFRDQLEASERSNAALRGEITKAKKRAQAGVCPCCKRTFQNVARHMAGQHPNFAEER